MSKITWKPGTMVYPLPPVMVSCGDMKNSNILTVAWTGIVCTEPAMTYISIRKERYSYDIIKRNKEFVINLASSDMAKIVDFCGVKSGKNIDKFSKCNLTKQKATKVSSPMISECPINIECRVSEIKELGSHDMFLAEILAVNVDDKYLDETGRFDMQKCDLLAYSHGEYFSLGKKLGKFGFSVQKRKSQKTK